MKQIMLGRIRADRQCRVAVGAGLFFLLTTVIGMLLSSMAAWDAVYRGRVETLTQLSSTLTENVRRVFDSGDQTIRVMRREYELSHQVRALPLLGAELNHIGKLWHQVAIADQSGMMVATSGALSVAATRAVNLADRPHFLWHVEHAEDVPHVSPVVMGRASGKLSIQLSRRLRGPQGAFGGMIVASCSPEYFMDYFSSVAAVGGKKIGISLVGNDGFVRAYSDTQKTQYGAQLGDDSMFGKTKNIKAGHVQAVSRVDGIEKLYVFDSIEEYGLKLFINYPLSELRREWWGAVESSLILGLLLIAITIGAMVSIVRIRLSEITVMAALRAREHDLAAANAFQARMIASVSHELRTPLTSILGYAFLIGEFEGDEEIRGYGKTICAAGEHLRMVINGILDLSRKERGKMEAHFAEVDVRKVLAQSVDLFRITAQQKGIELVLDIAEGVPAVFISDYTKLAQIVENLMSNAIKFSDTGRVSVRVDTVDGGGSLAIVVKDTGPGIPAAALPRLFEPFNDVKGDAYQKQKGAGLGLNIVLEFATLLGGRVAVVSTLGVGSSFTVTLPLGGSRNPDATG
jgi:signal transduction histidine kinase